MRWFGRRRQAFDPLGERVTREVELTVTSPRVTAAEALALCRPVALDVDERATLKMVVGHDITPDGHSHRWDLLFDGRGVLANVNVDLVLDLVSGPTDVVLAAMQTEDGPIWRLTVGRDEATRPLT